MAIVYRNFQSVRRRYYIIQCGSHKIRTTVTATPSVVRDWIKQNFHYHKPRLHSKTLVVGLGVGVLRTDVKKKRIKDQRTAATLNLCVGRRCLIFQLLHARRVPKWIQRFLSDSDITFVGSSKRVLPNSEIDLLDLLENSKHGLCVENFLDLFNLEAVKKKFSDDGTKRSPQILADKFLGLKDVNVGPPIGRKWNKFELSDDNVKNACLEAFLYFLTRKALRVWNK